MKEVIIYKDGKLFAHYRSDSRGGRGFCPCNPFGLWTHEHSEVRSLARKVIQEQCTGVVFYVEVTKPNEDNEEA